MTDTGTGDLVKPETINLLQCVAEDDYSRYPPEVKRLCATAATQLSQAADALEAAERAFLAAEELYMVGLLGERNGLYERVHKLRRDWLARHATGQKGESNDGE